MAEFYNFDLTIVFTGICSLITDKSIGEQPTNLYVVLADSWFDQKKTEKKPLDDKDYLIRHGPMVQLPLKNLEPLVSSAVEGSVIFYPKRHRLDFDFGEIKEENKFNVQPDMYKYVADMTKIAPGFSKILPSDEVIGDKPNKDVLANAKFSSGFLQADTKETAKWEFDSVLAGGKITIDKMAYRITLTHKNIQRVTLGVSKLGGTVNPRPGNPGSGEPRKFTLIARRENEKIEITVANSCDENPLIWPTKAYPEDEDVDFKWHYEVLPQNMKIEMKKALQGTPLPFPIQVPPLGNGRNCFPAFWIV